LIASFIHPDLRVVEMYVHHSLAALLAYFSLHPYSHGFGFFFFGLVEISNFPLNFVDLCDHFEGRPIAKKLVTFNLVCKVLFAICFIVFRLVMWPILSVDMWIGSYQLLMSGNAHSNAVVMFFALGNIALTLLQFYWGWKIFGVAFEMFCKKKEKVAEFENGGSAPAKKQK
jgi:nitrate reductase NapE component